MRAMTTPTGRSPSEPRHEVRRRQQHRAEERRQRHEPPRGRPDEQAHDVRHDEPDEADQPADGHRRGRRQRGEPEEDPSLAPDVEPEVARRRVAEQEPVERSARASSSARHAPRISGAAMRRRVHDDPPRPPSRNEKIWRRFVPETYIAIVSSAASTELIGIAGEQEPGQTPGRTGTADAEDEIGRREGAREREPVEQAELDDDEPDRDEHRDRRTEGRARSRCRGCTDRRGDCGSGPGTWRRRRPDRRPRAWRSGPAARAGPTRWSRWPPTRSARGRGPASRQRMTPTVSPGPIRTDPSVDARDEQRPRGR